MPAMAVCVALKPHIFGAVLIVAAVKRLGRFAAGVLWERCARDAGSADPEATITAARGLTTTTLFGRFRLDPVTGLQAGHRVGVVQWHGGRRRVVTPPR